MKSEDYIKIVDLKKSFNGKNALNNLNLNIKKGELLGLIGPDGAGKTTFLRILATVIEPDSGEIFIERFSILKEKEKIKEKISYVPQKFGLYEDLSIYENLNFYGNISDISRREKIKKIEEILDFIKLKEFKNRLAGNLSGGMKQKLSLGCALMGKPEILLLDEPTNGLDPVSRKELWKILYSLLKEKATILISTSYLDEAENCTKIILMDRGNILFEGNPAYIKNSFNFPVLEIMLDFPKEATEILKNENYVLSIIAYGDRIHLILKEFSFKEKIYEVLLKKGFKVIKEREVLPSIEDIFIFKMEKNGK